MKCALVLHLLYFKTEVLNSRNTGRYINSTVRFSCVPFYRYVYRSRSFLYIYRFRLRNHSSNRGNNAYTLGNVEAVKFAGVWRIWRREVKAWRVTVCVRMRGTHRTSRRRLTRDASVVYLCWNNSRRANNESSDLDIAHVRQCPHCLPRFFGRKRSEREDIRSLPLLLLTHRVRHIYLRSRCLPGRLQEIKISFCSSYSTFNYTGSVA